MARRAELIAIGRKLFADTSYDALSMDDIARQAHVAKGLIYYYFQSKRGYYLAIIQDSVADLVTYAASGLELPQVDRVHRTIDSYLRYAEHNQAAYRTDRQRRCRLRHRGARHPGRRCARRSSRPSPRGVRPHATSPRWPAWACSPGCAASRAPPSTGSTARPALPRHHARPAGEDAGRLDARHRGAGPRPTRAPAPARRGRLSARSRRH